MPQPTPISIDHLPHSPLGPVWVALSSQGLWALEFQINEYEFKKIAHDRGPAKIANIPFKSNFILTQLAQYLNGDLNKFSLPIDWTGMTNFQIIVRKAVIAIPSGQTASYGEIANRVGRPKAARAVGLANATNPIPLVIPCHRVIGANGALTGYGGAGGLKTKQWLLDLEKGNL